MKRSRRITLLSGLGIAAMMLLAAALLTPLGSSGLGRFETWQQALESARPYLRLWRVLLYSALFALWWDLYRRYRHRPPDRLRVQRIGAMGLLFFTFVELTRL
ncbi:hypothetical protein [Pseudomonas sp. PS01303]|uniref:hypothetical protein n=1 Tax=Pseudomonas sp. PS01303 TaxID=2991439 RepID=UPI00249A7B80|nr:hypothetical protein [Pseudomonas sp. PS01303]